MNSLPNDIIEKIYYEKHKMEMVEVLDDIKNMKQLLHDDIESLILYFENAFRYDPEVGMDLAILLASLRNEGYITDLDLQCHIIKLNEYIYFFVHTDEYYDEIDIDSVMFNTFVSFKGLVKAYKDILPNSRLNKYEYDQWIDNNVV